MLERGPRAAIMSWANGVQIESQGSRERVLAGPVRCGSRLRFSWPSDDLMIGFFEKPPPEQSERSDPSPRASIIETNRSGKNAEDRFEQLSKAHHKETLDNMAACCTFPASLWESAWVAGVGESAVKKARSSTTMRRSVRSIGSSHSFRRSLSLI